MVMAASESLFHVLAVDDSVIDRKLIERLLKTSSYQVTTVDSGSKALEFLGLRDDEISHPHPPACPPTKHSQEVVEVNLVITDYCMPGMTGYDLLKKMKESSSLRNIPVVIMSSENVPSRISRCLEEGAEEFFLKPVRLSDVNKLKPHMLKTKTKSHENNNPDPDNSKPPEKQDEQEQELPTTATSLFPAEKLECGSQEAAETDDQQCDNSMNKRKGVEESASPDRTRSRYSSGLTAVSN